MHLKTGFRQGFMKLTVYEMEAYTSTLGLLTYSSVRIKLFYPIWSFSPVSGLVILLLFFLGSVYLENHEDLSFGIYR